MQEKLISQFFKLLEAYDVRDVVCSPGSRNAALLMAVDGNDSFRAHVVTDERSAGFIALGMAVASRRPVALVCTSGSALLNYAPAIAEAYYQGVPLVAVSADRPFEWIDQDDSQTIRQPGALSNIVKCEYDLTAKYGDDEDYLWFANRIVNEGLQRCLAPKAGPVHFNIHLDGNVAEEVYRAENVRKIERITPAQRLSTQQIKEFAERAKGRKIMFTAGFMEPDHKMQKAVSLLASLPNVCVMAETLSNLHLPPECTMVDTALFAMSEEEKHSLKPDILISTGGALVSRKLKEFLRENQPEEHWNLGVTENIVDCFKALTTQIDCIPYTFLQTLGKLLACDKGGPDYRREWSEIREKTSVGTDDIGWSDLKALASLFRRLPSDTNLVLSNGTCVRYGQILPLSKTHAIYSNRGVSGIEGCTSTAVGIANVYGGITCLVTGDMSFGYDIAALASGMLTDNLRIVVLDNGGGEIFRFIKATKKLSIREKYLATENRVPIEDLAETYGLRYFYAASEKTLKKALPYFFRKDCGPAILHLDTRNAGDNAAILEKYLTDRK